MNSIIKETSKQMRIQNNRATQYPLFVIQDKKTYPTHNDYCDYHAYINDDGEEVDEEDVCEDCQEKAEGGEFNDLNCCINCGVKRYLPIKEVWEFDLSAGVFFTEKACHKHIECNNYHYSKNVRSYVVGAWRNIEMVKVMQSLLKLTGEEIPNQYK